MIVKGSVVSVEFDIQVPKNGGGAYPGSRLTYRDETGAIKEKALHSNVFKFNPGLKTQLSNLNVGQTFDMEQIKEGEFLNVKSILPTAANTSTTPTQETSKATPYASPKSTYATPEERAQIQVSIVRQSSIANAIKTIEIMKGKPTMENILALAKQYESFVHGKEFDDGTIYGMSNDTQEII